MSDQTTRERVDAAFTWVESTLRSLGFEPDDAFGGFVRGEGAEMLIVVPGIGVRGNLHSLNLRGAPDRIIAILTPPRGKGDE